MKKGSKLSEEKVKMLKNSKWEFSRACLHFFKDAFTGFQRKKIEETTVRFVRIFRKHLFEVLKKRIHEFNNGVITRLYNFLLFNHYIFLYRTQLRTGKIFNF